MKKLLKMNPQYLISIGLILMGIGGVFFDETSDTGFGILLLGSLSTITGALLGLLNKK